MPTAAELLDEYDRLTVESLRLARKWNEVEAERKAVRQKIGQAMAGSQWEVSVEMSDTVARELDAKEQDHG